MGWFNISIIQYCLLEHEECNFVFISVSVVFICYPFCNWLYVEILDAFVCVIWLASEFIMILLLQISEWLVL